MPSLIVTIRIPGPAIAEVQNIPTIPIASITVDRQVEIRVPANEEEELELGEPRGEEEMGEDMDVDMEEDLDVDMEEDLDVMEEDLDVDMEEHIGEDVGEHMGDNMDVDVEDGMQIDD
jgi:hypothetical protein